MPTIRVPHLLRPYVQNQAEVPVEGETVSNAMESLMVSFPKFRSHLFRQDGSLRAYVNLFINGVNIRELNGLDTHLEPEDVLVLIPSIAGG